MKEFAEFENIIGYTFQNKALLRNALTHSSYINEHKLQRNDCNERIEFLGDAVLELVSSEYLYKLYPDEEEGKLTRLRAALVCEPALAFDAKPMQISRFLRLGKGEDQCGGRYRDSVVSDAVEAVIGAIYLDGGIESAKTFIHHFILDDINKAGRFFDAKSELQELAQDILGATPEYTITGSSGPDHAKTFSASVTISGQPYGEGTGSTKKQAEQSAAWTAMNNLKNS